MGASGKHWTPSYGTMHHMEFSSTDHPRTALVPQVSFMAPFHSASFPHCLAVAAEGALSIGLLEPIQRLHVRTLALGEQPRRITHQAATRTLGVLVQGEVGRPHRTAQHACAPRMHAYAHATCLGPMHRDHVCKEPACLPAFSGPYGCCPGPPARAGRHHL